MSREEKDFAIELMSREQARAAKVDFPRFAGAP
jgi:hypothetical protein